MPKELQRAWVSRRRLAPLLRFKVAGICADKGYMRQPGLRKRDVPAPFLGQAPARRGSSGDVSRGVRVTDSVEFEAQQRAVTDMRTLVLEITRALVDETEAVQLDVLNDAGSTVLRLRVSPRDLGKVIGKQGRTARSLRTILGAASMKLKHRFALDIVEVDEPGD